MPAKCHPRIISLCASDSCEWDTGTHTWMHAGMSKHSHMSIFNKLGSGPFQNTYTTVSPVGPVFTTLWSPVCWLFVLFLVEGQELIDRNSHKIHCRSYITACKFTPTVTFEFCFKIWTAEALLLRVSHAQKISSQTQIRSRGMSYTSININTLQWSLHFPVVYETKTDFNYDLKVSVVDIYQLLFGIFFAITIKLNLE